MPPARTWASSRPSAPASRRSRARAWHSAASSCCRRASATTSRRSRPASPRPPTSPASPNAARRGPTRRMLIELALAEARARLERDADGQVARLGAAVQDGSLRLREAAAKALELVSSPPRPDPHPNPLPQAGEGEEKQARSSETLSRLRERVG